MLNLFLLLALGQLQGFGQPTMEPVVVAVITSGDEQVRVMIQPAMPPFQAADKCVCFWNRKTGDCFIGQLVRKLTIRGMPPGVSVDLAASGAWNGRPAKIHLIIAENMPVPTQPFVTQSFTVIELVVSGKPLAVSHDERRGTGLFMASDPQQPMMGGFGFGNGPPPPTPTLAEQVASLKALAVALRRQADDADRRVADIQTEAAKVAGSK